MPTNFISTLPRLGLYSVWIPTGNPRQPLACIWIDPEMRSYGLKYFQQAPADCAETYPLTKKTQTCRDPKLKSSTRLVAFKVSRLSETNRNRVRWVALVLLALSLLLNPACADVGSRITGVVTDPSNAFVADASVILTNPSNGTKQTATTNQQGRYSSPVVSDGKYELEISAPGFQTYKKIGIGIDVNTVLQIDAALQIKQSQESIDVKAAPARIGQVALKFNFRPYDDLRIVSVTGNGTYVEDGRFYLRRKMHCDPNWYFKVRT